MTPRLILMLLLVLSSAPAYAEWVKVGTSDKGMNTSYVDPDTIRRNGDLVKIWTLLDYKTIQTVADASYLSSRTQRQFDCAEELVRSLAVTWFSGNMGNGNQVWNDSDASGWDPVAPGSIGLTMWKFACAKP